MLLGAGRGTRLATLGLDVPKILVDVAGEPLLARQLRYLATEGASRVVVNAHHMSDQVRAFAREHSGIPELVVVTEPQLLGTAGGVRHALSYFGSDPIVVLYGDVLTTTQLSRLLATHIDSRTAATITVYESFETRGKGTVEVQDDRLVRFREKMAPTEPISSALINAGLYVVDPAFVAELVGDDEVADFGHDVFPRALERGIGVGVYRLPQPVLDIGTPAKLSEAQGGALRGSYVRGVLER